MDQTSMRKQMTLQLILEAKKRVYQVVKPTPFFQSIQLSEQYGSSVYLKLENFHEIGAFKVRGAANKILQLSNEEQKRGVATFSTGNHGLAVAYVAKKGGFLQPFAYPIVFQKQKWMPFAGWGLMLKLSGKGKMMRKHIVMS